MGAKLRKASANVFADLGFGAGEAEHLRIRSELMIELSRFIDVNGLTQAEAARRFGVSQPRISDLVRGKIARFSIDTLVTMLGHVGTRVTISTTRRARVA